MVERGGFRSHQGFEVATGFDAGLFYNFLGPAVCGAHRYLDVNRVRPSGGPGCQSFEGECFYVSIKSITLMK